MAQATVTQTGDIQAAITCQFFRKLSVQITGSWSGTITVYGSNDGANWVAQTQTSVGGNVTSMTANGLYTFSINYFYCKITCDTLVSGSLVATWFFSEGDYIPAVQTIATASTGSVVAIDQSTPGTTNYTESRSDCRRAAGILHRSGITAADKLSPPTVSAASAVTEAGSTLANVAYKYTACAGNRWGPTTGAAVQTITPTANQSVRIPIAQVAGADYYDIFLSTDAAPLWVGRITEAQRASGGFIISTVGTVTAGSSAAGTIDIGIVGTGTAWNVAQFASNNAFKPASVTPISFAGYCICVLQFKLTLTDLRSAPSLRFSIFSQCDINTDDWMQGAAWSPAILAGTEEPLLQEIALAVYGPTNLVVLVDLISGQGASVTVTIARA